MIKNLIYKLVGINPLTREQIQKTLEQEKYISENRDIIASFNFFIDSQGRLFIDGNWVEISEPMADIVAHFLFLLNSGSLKGHISQYFLNSQKQLNSPEQKQFINKIMEKWTTLMKKQEDKENEPLIKPSKAFAMNQAKTVNLEETNNEE